MWESKTELRARRRDERRAGVSVQERSFAENKNLNATCSATKVVKSAEAKWSETSGVFDCASRDGKGEACERARQMVDR